MPRKLKVFRAHLGFYDTVVAVPSRKAALEAWGSRQDLFREGFAKETDDAAARKDALAAPGQVLRRPFGSDERFTQNPSLPSVGASRSRGKPSSKPAISAKPERATNAKAARAAEAKAARDAGKAARERARAAEEARRREAKLKTELKKLETEEEAALADFARRRAALDKEKRAAQDRFQKKREKLRSVYGALFRPRLVG